MGKARQQKSVNTSELVRLFTEYGPSSNEFAEYCKNFIIFLQLRYMGSVDEDCQQYCWKKLMSSFKYYDAERGANLATWVYSVVRNEISGFLYRKRKVSNEISLEDESLQGEGSVNSLSEDPDTGDYSEEQAQWLLKSFKRLEVQWNGDAEVVDSLRALGFENSLVRTVLWASMTSGLTFR